MKILLIEDDIRLSDSIKALLTAKGFQVEAVYDGETGADYALLGIYDLLILDVMMPGHHPAPTVWGCPSPGKSWSSTGDASGRRAVGRAMCSSSHCLRLPDDI